MWLDLLLAVDQAPSGEGGAPAWSSLPLLVGLVLIFWLLVFMPQRRQEKQRQELVSKLKRNDRIVNSGGIIGVVDSVKDKDEEVVLKGGLRITRSSIVKVLNPDESSKDGTS